MGNAQGEQMTPKDAVLFVKDGEIKIVDLRFTDLFGMWHHFSMPAQDFTEELFTEGIGFDGSSIRGFQAINESDMLLIPDPSTVFADPFGEFPTAVAICDIVDPITKERYTRDPRFVAQKAEQYLRSSGIGDTAFFGPEAEFFLFDRLRFDNSPRSAFFEIDSAEASWNSGLQDATGYTMRPKGGYFPCPPSDRLQDVRNEMLLKLIDVGAAPEVHHHEVGGPGQCEIDLRFDTLVTMADKLQKYKYVIRNVAAQYGLCATFMPKPVFGDNGSGMHVHFSIWKDGSTLMYDDKGYAGLSDTARWSIGGILKHAASLLAFCAPTTNSYRRLVPGYEAPINLIYSSRNRSACVRIPMYSKAPKAKRIEFRAPDPTANGYLAFSAILMAAIDGIQNRIEPAKPIDKDLYELPPLEKADIPQTPGSLRATLHALRGDHDFLMKGDVFTEDLLNAYIEYKITVECDGVDLRPHPYEFYLYNDA
jgi:glutamine synthetase